MCSRIECLWGYPQAGEDPCHGQVTDNEGKALVASILGKVLQSPAQKLEDGLRSVCSS